MSHILLGMGGAGAKIIYHLSIQLAEFFGIGLDGYLIEDRKLN